MADTPVNQPASPTSSTPRLSPAYLMDNHGIHPTMFTDDGSPSDRVYELDRAKVDQMDEPTAMENFFRNRSRAMTQKDMTLMGRTWEDWAPQAITSVAQRQIELEKEVKSTQEAWLAGKTWNEIISGAPGINLIATPEHPEVAEGLPPGEPSKITAPVVKTTAATKGGSAEGDFAKGFGHGLFVAPVNSTLRFGSTVLNMASNYLDRFVPDNRYTTAMSAALEEWSKDRNLFGQRLLGMAPPPEGSDQSLSRAGGELIGEGIAMYFLGGAVLRGLGATFGLATGVTSGQAARATARLAKDLRRIPGARGLLRYMLPAGRVALRDTIGSFIGFQPPVEATQAEPGGAVRSALEAVNQLDPQQAADHLRELLGIYKATLAEKKRLKDAGDNAGFFTQEHARQSATIGILSGSLEALLLGAHNVMRWAKGRKATEAAPEKPADPGAPPGPTSMSMVVLEQSISEIEEAIPRLTENAGKRLEPLALPFEGATVSTEGAEGVSHVLYQTTDDMLSGLPQVSEEASTRITSDLADVFDDTLDIQVFDEQTIHLELGADGKITGGVTPKTPKGPGKISGEKSPSPKVEPEVTSVEPMSSPVEDAVITKETVGKTPKARRRVGENSGLPEMDERIQAVRGLHSTLGKIIRDPGAATDDLLASLRKNPETQNAIYTLRANPSLSPQAVTILDSFWKALKPTLEVPQRDLGDALVAALQKISKSTKGRTPRAGQKGVLKVLEEYMFGGLAAAGLEVYKQGSWDDFDATQVSPGKFLLNTIAIGFWSGLTYRLAKTGVNAFSAIPRLFQARPVHPGILTELNDPLLLAQRQQVLGNLQFSREMVNRALLKLEATGAADAATLRDSLVSVKASLNKAQVKFDRMPLASLQRFQQRSLTAFYSLVSPASGQVLAPVENPIGIIQGLVSSPGTRGPLVRGIETMPSIGAAEAYYGHVAKTLASQVDSHIAAGVREPDVLTSLNKHLGIAPADAKRLLATPEDTLRFALQFDELANLAAEVKTSVLPERIGALHNYAKALEALIRGDRPGAEQAFVKTPAIYNWNPKVVDTFHTLVKDLSDEDALRMLQLGAHVDTPEALKQLRFVSILSRPGTPLKTIPQNAATCVLGENLKKVLEAGIGVGTGIFSDARVTTFSDIGRAWAHMFTQVGNLKQLTVEAWKTGEKRHALSLEEGLSGRAGSALEEDFLSRLCGAVPGTWQYEFLNSAGRKGQAGLAGLIASDELSGAYAFCYDAALEALKRVDTTMPIPRSVEPNTWFNQVYRSVMEDRLFRDPTLFKTGVMTASNSKFPGLNKLYDLMASPIASFFQPFPKVIMNGLTYMHENTLGAIRDLPSHTVGSQGFNEALARGTYGFGLIGLGYSLSRDGYLSRATGDVFRLVHADRKTSEAYRGLGVIGGTALKVGSAWVPLRLLGPVGYLIGLGVVAGNIASAYENDQENDSKSTAGMFVAATEGCLNEAILGEGGFDEYMRILTDVKQGGLSYVPTLVAKTLQSFTPGIVRDVESIAESIKTYRSDPTLRRRIDQKFLENPEFRRFATVLDQWLDKGYSSTTVLNDPKVTSGIFMGSTRVPPETAKGDREFYEECARVSVDLGTYGREKDLAEPVGGLEPQERELPAAAREYQRARMAARVRELWAQQGLKSSGYARLATSDQLKAKWITDKILEPALELARIETMQKYPQLTELVRSKALLDVLQETDKRGVQMGAPDFSGQRRQARQSARDTLKDLRNLTSGGR